MSNCKEGTPCHKAGKKKCSEFPTFEKCVEYMEGDELKHGTLKQVGSEDMCELISREFKDADGNVIDEPASYKLGCTSCLEHNNVKLCNTEALAKAIAKAIAEGDTGEPEVKVDTQDIEYVCYGGTVHKMVTPVVNGVAQPTIDTDMGIECGLGDGEPLDVSMVFPDEKDIYEVVKCVDGVLTTEVWGKNETTGDEALLHSVGMDVPCGKCVDFNSLTLYIANPASYNMCLGEGALANDFNATDKCKLINSPAHQTEANDTAATFRAEYCYSSDKPINMVANDPDVGGHVPFIISVDGGEVVEVHEAFTLPAGCHCVRAEMAYDGGHARLIGFQYNGANAFPAYHAWANPDMAYHCILAKICKPSGDIFDHVTGEAIKPDMVVPCACTQAWKDNQVSVSGGDSLHKHCIQLYGWDGMLDEDMVKEGSDQGDLMDFNVKIDGVDHLMEIDYFATSDHVNKSTWYPMVVDYINSQPGLTMTLVQDASVDADGDNHDAPLWKLEYEGNTPKEVVFHKSGGESIMTIKFDGQGNVETEGNWDYSDGTSNPYVDC